MKKTKEFIFKIFLVALLLYMFLLSIGLMGAAFKGFGREFAENLIRTTSNPFVGLFIGILATSLVQSSSTTTSIIVGIVGSGGMAVGNAIPIIMGANIGTTVTNTLVSLGHVSRREEFKRAMGAAAVHDFFNLICVCILFPLELITRFFCGKGFLERGATTMSALFENVGGIKFVSPLKLATEPVVHFIQNVVQALIKSSVATNIAVLVLSFLILFFALFFIVKIMKSLVVERAEIILNNVLNRSKLAGFAAGLAFTAIVQSSSITTSLLIPMVAAGIFTVKSVFPITLGANIGTTGTAILASFATGNPAAITVAFVHFLFNLTGIVCIYPIKVFRRIPIKLALGLGELAARKRGYTFFGIIGVFFLLPALLIFIYRLFC